MVFGDARCAACGKGFRYPRDFGVVRYCSALCRVTDQPPVYPWEYKGCRSKHYYSKSRRRAYAQGDLIDPLVIYVAFDWTCVLCRGRIDPTLQMPDPMSASIDHIVPLRAGGGHTWDNVVPAHLQHNNEKDTI